MNIIVILILLFIGLPMVGTLIMTMFGIGLWILKMLWGLFTDGFVGSSSSDGTPSGRSITNTSTVLLGDLSTPITALCSNPDRLEREELTSQVNMLAERTIDCETNYKQLKRGGYVVNTCLLSQMYVNSVLPLLDEEMTATTAEMDANVTAAKDLTVSFCDAQPDFDKDLYLDIVRKFNEYEAAMNTYLKTISLNYKYNIPIVLSSADYEGAAAARYNSSYPLVKSPKSYACVTFGEEEQSLIRVLKGRIFGTLKDRDAIATTITANLCTAKGWGNGAEASSYKGCGAGCLGCCRPSTDELARPAAVAGVNAVTADGSVIASGTAVDAKCAQPVLREYTLKRKPARFAKTPSPTDALFECFKDGAEEEMGMRRLDLREAARTAKADKRSTLRQHM